MFVTVDEINVFPFIYLIVDLEIRWSINGQLWLNGGLRLAIIRRVLFKGGYGERYDWKREGRVGKAVLRNDFAQSQLGVAVWSTYEEQ